MNKNDFWGLNVRLVESLRGFTDACRRAGHTTVLASGYFTWLHDGHVAYLAGAAELGTKLIVVVNNDIQLHLKRNDVPMPEQARLAVVRAIKGVDFAVLAVDADRSISRTLELVRPDVFANGGDVRSEADCRESDTCRKLGICMHFGVGGSDKIRSSSDLIRRAVSAN